MVDLEHGQPTIPSAIFFDAEKGRVSYGRDAIRNYVEGIEGRLMREATVALTMPGRLVADVAVELGYDEPSHFSRAFRRWAGVTPVRLRSRR